MQALPRNEHAVSDFQIHDLTAAVAQQLGSDVRFEITIVESIDFEQSGKFRVSRSRVRSEYDRVETSVGDAERLPGEGNVSGRP